MRARSAQYEFLILNSKFLIPYAAHNPGNESWITSSWITEPGRRDEPDKGEDRDHPDVVGQRGALVGPEEGAVEEAGDAFLGRQRQAIEIEVGVVDAVGDRENRQDQHHPQHAGHPVGGGANHQQHDALGALHEADLALLHQRLGAGPRVAGHDREDQRQRRDHYVVAASQLRVEEDQAGQQRQIREAIERRIPERAELGDGVGEVRDLAVDEVEDVRDQHDHERQHEVAEAERPRCGDVDDHPDQRQRVRMDPQRDAQVDDRAQRLHAGRADDARERPSLVLPEMAGFWRVEYNRGFSHSWKTRHSTVWPSTISRSRLPGCPSSPGSICTSTRMVTRFTSARRGPCAIGSGTTWAPAAPMRKRTHCSTKSFASNSSSPTRWWRRSPSRTISSSSARPSTTSSFATTRTTRSCS